MSPAPPQPSLRNVFCRVLFGVLAGVAVAAGAAETLAGRGVWWWSGGSSVLRVQTALGDPELEDRALATLLAYDFNWLYESSGSLVSSNPARVAAWHRRLAANGIGVQLLLSENTWIFPEHRDALLALVQSRLLDFNAARPVSEERFTGLHLDIEPQGLDAWRASTQTPEGRRALLAQLGETYAAVRDYLDVHGGTGLVLQADLPVWFDNLGGSVGWADAADRDAWFAGIGGALDAVSLMAYERPYVNSINNGVAWELANFSGQTRVALEFDIGAGATWPALSDLFAAAETLEIAHGASIGTDLHSFNQLSDLAPAPVLPPWLSQRAWRIHHFGSAEAVGAAAVDADPDGDGLVNLLEYALGADPQVSTAPPRVEHSGAGAVFVFNRMRPASDIVYRVERSVDLRTWATFWSSEDHPWAGGAVLSANEAVAVPPAPDGAPRCFVRLCVDVR